MELGVQFIIHLVFACAVAAIANSKGRHPVGWFFIGLVVPCIGLIIILVLNDERAAERARNQDRADRRRLREQLRQERMKTEAYRRHAAARLDAHDQHLGIDTRGLASLPEGHGAQGTGPQALGEGVAQPGFVLDADPASDPGVTPVSATAGAAAGADGARVKEWFYELSGESRGPVSEAAIRMGLRQQKIEGTTLVWREGMPNWQAVSEVPTFAANFHG